MPSTIWSRAWAYLLKLYEKYYRDAAPFLAAAIAYATLFSLLPLLLLSVSLMGFLIASPELQDRIIELAAAGLPRGLGEIIRNNVRDIVGGRGLSGFLAAIGLIISALGVFGSLEYSFNRIFKAERQRGTLRSILLHLAMTAFMMALLFLAYGAALGVQLVGGLLPLENLGAVAVGRLYAVAATATSVAMLTIFFLAAFTFIPNIRLRLRDSLPIAFGAAVMWEIARYFFGVYLQTLAKYSVVYGSIGAVIALLTWIYISTTILLIAAEIISLKKLEKVA